MGGGLEREKKPSGVPGNAKNMAIGGHPAIHWESNPGSFSLLQNVMTSYPALFLLFVLSVVMRWLSRTPPRARALSTPPAMRLVDADARLVGDEREPDPRVVDRPRLVADQARVLSLIHI